MISGEIKYHFFMKKWLFLVINDHKLWTSDAAVALLGDICLACNMFGLLKK